MHSYLLIKISLHGSKKYYSQLKLSLRARNQEHNTEYYKSLGGNVSQDTRQKQKGAETVPPHDWPSFHVTQCDWLQG